MSKQEWIPNQSECLNSQLATRIFPVFDELDFLEGRRRSVCQRHHSTINLATDNYRPPSEISPLSPAS